MCNRVTNHGDTSTFSKPAVGVEEYDSVMRRCAEESLQKTFKRRTNKNVKMREPAWMTGKLRDEIKKRKKINCREEEKLEREKLYWQ